MSKQLAISAAFSIFAMVSFALFSTTVEFGLGHQMASGANALTSASASAPATFPSLPEIDLSDR